MFFPRDTGHLKSSKNRWWRPLKLEEGAVLLRRPLLTAPVQNCNNSSFQLRDENREIRKEFQSFSMSILNDTLGHNQHKLDCAEATGQATWFLQQINCRKRKTNQPKGGRRKLLTKRDEKYINHLEIQTLDSASNNLLKTNKQLLLRLLGKFEYCLNT